VDSKEVSKEVAEQKRKVFNMARAVVNNRRAAAKGGKR
jgi:hypothetical protein